MLLGRRAEAFDPPEWLFELKYDGAFVDGGSCRLVWNDFGSFESLALALPRDLRPRSAVLDGEIVPPDPDGRPNFSDLFYRRREPIFMTFNLFAARGRT